MPFVTIIAGPHVLFVGQKGHKTAGITVRSTKTREQCREQGKMYEWDLNAYDLARSMGIRFDQSPIGNADPNLARDRAEDFGITIEELRDITDACIALEA